jgi:hypothetical protein
MTLRYFCRFALAVLAALSLPPALGGQPAPAPLSTAASLVGGQKAHLFGGQFDPNNATAVPAEIKPEWAALIGEYGPELGRFYVLEDGGELQILAGWFDLETLHPFFSWCREGGSNPQDRKDRRILSLSRIP